MAVEISNECVGCGLPCLGDSCPNRNVKRLYCDCCGEEVDELYCYFDDSELCEDCVKEKVFAELEVIR